MNEVFGLAGSIKREFVDQARMCCPSLRAGEPGVPEVAEGRARMGIAVRTEDGEQISIVGNSAIIGSDSGCQISFVGDARIKAHHATIRRVGNRWLIEGDGDVLVQVGQGDPARMHWLEAGSGIQLSADGPRLIFEPFADTQPAASLPVRDVPPPVSSVPPVTSGLSQSTATASPRTIADPRSAASFAPRIPKLPVAASDPPAGIRSTSAEEPLDVVNFDDAASPVVANPMPANRHAQHIGPSRVAERRAVGEPERFPRSAADAGGPHPILKFGIPIVASFALPLLVLWYTGQFSGAGRVTPSPVPLETPDAGLTPSTSSPPVEEMPAPTVTSLIPDVPNNVPMNAIIDPAACVYTIAVSKPDNEDILALGTGWAATEHQVVTSGEILLGIEVLGGSGYSVVRVYCPKTGKILPVTSRRIHPRFQEAHNDEQETALEWETAWSKFEEADESEKPDLIPRLRAIEDRRYQAIERKVDFDLGVLTVEGRLPACLPVGPVESAPKRGKQVIMWGLPMSSDRDAFNAIIDFEAPAVPQEYAAQVLDRQRASGKFDYARLLIRGRLDLSDQIWSGSPVLDDMGTVVAVYSRQTPPLPEVADAPQVGGRHPTITSHDTVPIRRLAELAPEIVR